MSEPFPADATVLVTGGAGFIGSHLVRALVQRGARKVVALDSLRYGDPGNLGATERVELVRHELGTSPHAQLAAALRGVTHVFHLAAEKHNQSKDAPGDVVRANITGMVELLAQADVAGVQKVVFSSSLYAHGRYAGAPLAEDDVPEPRTIYGITKLAGEHLLRHFADAGLASVALRYFFVYGPRQWAGTGYRSVIVKNFERLLAGQDVLVLGDGRQELDYVYVDDVVDATIAAMARPVTDTVINIGSGTGTPIAALLAEMVRVSGRPAGAVHGPPDWTAGTRRIATVDRAAALLGWRATTSLADGLARTLAWMKDPTAA
jgi:UDP-glucose 4-epimerase